MAALPPAVGQTEKLRRALLRLPILVYLGWICVATIANLTALLVTLQWDGFGLSPLVWTVVAILAGLAIGLLLIWRRGAISSALVIIWAYLGIVLKRSGTDPNETMPIIVVAIINMLVLAAACLFYWLKQRSAKPL